MSLMGRSYAKVNLLLRVLNKRPDGYHNIYTILCAVDFSDSIMIKPAKRTFLRSTGIKIPINESNIILKVDKILRAEYNLKQAYHITVNKRIPVGAGLGGGSSNACTYLQLVNESASLGLSLDQQHEILSCVGSDAPFFLYTPMALGEGRGEILTPLKNEGNLHFILINPRIFISTASVYNDKKLQLTSPSDLPKISDLLGTDRILEIMGNDLEEAVFSKYPLVKELCGALEKAGADRAMLSGSGSTVFGVFRDSGVRDKAFDLLRQEYVKYMIVKANSL